MSMTLFMTHYFTFLHVKCDIIFVLHA